MFLAEGIKGLMGAKALVIQENAPQILFGAGILSSIGSTVLACRATLKVDAILDEGKSNMEKIHKVEASGLEDYTHEDAKKDTVIVYVQTGLKIVKEYAPAIVLGGIGIACLTQSHHILMERNFALTAAYTAIDQAFSQYRSRVRDAFGEETDREMRYGVQPVEIVNPETGRKKTVKRVASGEPSGYARFFDKQSCLFSKDWEVNQVTVRTQQRHANDLLTLRGHVFLNEVYDMFDIPRTEAGAVVGWLRDGGGDGFIDFGLFRDDQTTRDFMNGYEGAVLLDFNVDGPIHNRIEGDKEPLRWQNP